MTETQPAPASTEETETAPAEAEAASAPVEEVRERPEISDMERDSLHILPLAMIPLTARGIQRARMIKNARLQTVIEIFNDEDAGSYQIEVESVGREFGWPDDPPHPDARILRELGQLHSFDIYSLRISLRALGIDVTSDDYLRLSPKKLGELTSYMTDFTMPLIKQIYGKDDVEIQTFADLIGLFRDPDVENAKKKLGIMAGKLGIGLDDVPAFLEDYGDIFLSLSYYRNCLDQIEPIISEFLEAIVDIRNNFQLKNDQAMMETCAQIEATINGLLSEITGRFENFDRSTADMWNEITAERFKKVKTLIESYHTTIGGVLCSLSVKMRAWAKQFPDPKMGGPQRRAGFIMSEIKQGIENIQTIEDSAPMLSELS